MKKLSFITLFATVLLSTTACGGDEPSGDSSANETIEVSQSIDDSNKLIGNAVTWIGHSAFEGCTDMNKLVVKAIMPPSCGDYTFEGSLIQTIYVPTESVEKYKAKSPWNENNVQGGAENMYVRRGAETSPNEKLIRRGTTAPPYLFKYLP